MAVTGKVTSQHTWTSNTVVNTVSDFQEGLAAAVAAGAPATATVVWPSAASVLTVTWSP